VNVRVDVSKPHSIAYPADAGREVYPIGAVADRVTLSLRTTRFYEQAGLLDAVGHDIAGSRLYDEDAVDRMLLVKKMKPLDFTVEEMRSLITLRNEAARPGLPAHVRAELALRLQTWVTLAEEKLAALEEQVRVAEAFLVGLHDDAEQARRLEP
jgi:DNA-binding transcriptional MerR regulator